MEPSDIYIEKLSKILNDLAEDGKRAIIRICPRCKSPNITWAPFKLDPIGCCTQAAKYECKTCGWVGRLEIYMTNEPISEKEEALLEDIHEIFEEELSDKKNK
ncbi:MAG: hypothetical protein ACTSO9_00865 [Candidatus Helarchaeota archaeon]